MALTTPDFWDLQKGYKPPAGNSAAGVTSYEFYLAQGAYAVPPTGVNPIAAAFWGSGSQSILTKDPFPQPVISGGGNGDGDSGEQPESGAYSKLVLAARPVMYLKCNENTGSTLTDSSGNGHDGTTEVPLEDAMAADLNPDNKDEAWAADYGAVNLDAGGTSWGFHFQNPLELGAGKDWTVEFLFQYGSNEEADGYLLQLGAAGNGCPGIVILPTTNAGYKIRVDASGQSTLATSPTTYSVDKTHILHLIQHADGSPTQLLIDGVEALSFTHAFGEYPNGPSTAGYANPWGYPSVGVIDEFALYQKALTPADIAARVTIAIPPPVFNVTYTANFDETVKPNWLTVDGGTAVLGGGLLKIQETTTDTNVRLTHNIWVPQSNIIQMRIKRAAGTGWDGMLFWINGHHDADAQFAKHVKAPAGFDADFVTLEWDMRTLTAAQLADWNSGVSALRFDLGNAPGGEFHIDWIKAGFYTEV